MSRLTKGRNANICYLHMCEYYWPSSAPISSVYKFCTRRRCGSMSTPLVVKMSSRPLEAKSSILCSCDIGLKRGHLDRTMTAIKKHTTLWTNNRKMTYGHQMPPLDLPPSYKEVKHSIKAWEFLGVIEEILQQYHFLKKRGLVIYERFVPFKVWVSWRLHFLNCKLALRTLQFIAMFWVPTCSLRSAVVKKPKL